MSWLGVNLNDSLSNIKGQISSFTRDVLAEEDEIRDGEIEVLIPKKKIKEYEASIFRHQQEIAELRNNRTEVEERLRASDYNSSQKIILLQKQLGEAQESLRNLQEKSSSWGWEEGVGGGRNSLSSSSQEAESVYLEKVSSLQKELEQEKSRREEETLSLQESFREELRRVKAKGTGNDDGTTENTALEHLRHENEALVKEKEELNASLVDLDNQHQLVIDEILKSKKQLNDELESLKSEVRRLKDSSQIQKEGDGNEELHHVRESLQSLLGEKAMLEKQVAEWKENAGEMQRTVNSQLEELQLLMSELDKSQRRRASLDQEKNRLEARVQELDLTASADSTHQECCLSKERTSKENEVLRQKLSEAECEANRKAKQIADFNDKIVNQEVEILKFEAVLEEKNRENASAFSKLKQHEKMTKLTITELQNDKQELRNKIQELESSYEAKTNNSEDVYKEKKYENIISELIDKCNVQSYECLPNAVSELNSEVASLRCERDRLSQDLSSISHDLRETQELVENLEGEKTNLEREAEDLRDQLEELQCGERPPPEGSLTPRSLPTIEEEEVDNSAAQGEGDNEAKAPKAEAEEGRSELVERIGDLNSQVTALSEARQNLELELSSVKREKLELEQNLREVNLQLGNLTNLEAEAVSLRNENESLQGRLDNSKDFLRSVSRTEEENKRLERQIQQMTNAMDKMNFDSAHLLSKEEENLKTKEALEDKLSGQNKTIHEYFHEIARLKALLNESSNSSSATNSEYEGRLATMLAELDKVKGLVIYKDDQIDQLRHGIEQIGQIFDIHDADLRHVYVHLKQKYFSLKTKLSDTEDEVEKLRDEIQDLRREQETHESEDEKELVNKLTLDLEATKNDLTKVQNELVEAKSSIDLLNLRNKELLDLKSEHEALISRNKELSSVAAFSQEEKLKLEEEIQFLKDEAASHESLLQTKEDSIKKLMVDSADTENNLRKTIQSLEADLTIKQGEIELLTQRISRDSSELETKYSQDSQTVREELEIVKFNEAKVKELNETLTKQISELQNERQEMILTSTRKHQESVTYYNEIQRLTDLLQQEKVRTTEEINALNQKLTEAVGAQQSALNEANNLRQTLAQLQDNLLPKEQVMKIQSDCLAKDEQIRSLKDELRKEIDASKVLLKERDHLRKANSSFNSQYEEKTKELASLQEKEKYLSQENQRLKQHLMEVEETYTKEALKSEQKEASLRQSLAKMHEKLASHSTHYSNANQKTNAQLESLQEQLQEAVHQRDEARMQLQGSEEASLQHQEALSRLQQVLHDFQKNQTRDVVMATERERRKYEEEREKNLQLEIEMRKMREKMDESESRVSSTKSLREELQAKEETVIALKSQVHAIQLAAKKSQEQVALLHSSSAAKVDKHLLRNLLVGYFATPSDKKPEVLRVVAEVLDFSPAERARTGIDQQPGSWLTSIANFLAPPPSNMVVTSKVDVLDHSSLSQAFIRFLEEESTPIKQPRLPAVEMAEETDQKAQKKAQTKNNAFINLDSTGVLSSASPTDASGSSSQTNVSFPAPPTSEAPSSSILLAPSLSMPVGFPIISTPTTPTMAVVSTPEGSTPKYLNNLLNSKEKKPETPDSS